MVLMFASVAAPPRCPFEIACNQVATFTKHHGTDCEDELFRNARFLAWILLICRDRTVNVGVVCEERHVKAPLARPIPRLLASLYQAIRAWYHGGE